MSDHGQFAHPVVEGLADGMVRLIRQGNDVVFVASGAVIAGKIFTGMDRALYPDHIKRPLAAIGQAALITECGHIFGRLDQPVGQILVGRDDFHHRERYLEIKNTLRALFRMNILPILNENDSVATEDSSFGDNDNLAAQLAGMLDADLLVLLSTVDGLYDGNPGHPGSRVIPLVNGITEGHLSEARYKGEHLASGGMPAKLAAIDKASHFGVPVILANGRASRVLARIFQGDDVGTYFQPRTNPLRQRKRWLAYSTHVKGSLVVDDGTCAALTRGRASLLSSGIVEVREHFGVRDVISIVSQSGEEIARGLTNYDWNTLQQIAGLNSAQLQARQWSEKIDEVVHRDNMVVLPAATGV